MPDIGFESQYYRPLDDKDPAVICSMVLTCFLYSPGWFTRITCFGCPLPILNGDKTVALFTFVRFSTEQAVVLAFMLELILCWHLEPLARPKLHGAPAFSFFSEIRTERVGAFGAIPSIDVPITVITTMNIFPAPYVFVRAWPKEIVEMNNDRRLRL
jgi:hypothetical protein